MIDLAGYTKVQAIAKAVHTSLKKSITTESTEASLVALAVERLLAHGVSETWYHDCPALVLLGSRSRLSISGRDYQPSIESVGRTNLITIDLSPLLDDAWGDCARSIAVENGVACDPSNSINFEEGMGFELSLHQKMREFVKPETSFEELHFFANREIESKGYENLDFMGNLGHSIVTRLKDRCYIEKGCNVKLGEVRFFTFEPHIAKLGSPWGFKHENIYYFDDQKRLQEL
jgi:Xaa-Pro aminopeptidase